MSNSKNYLARSNHSQKFLRIGVAKKFAGLKPATLLKRDFNIGVSLWILQNCKNSFFIEHLLWLLEFGLNSTTTFKWYLYHWNTSKRRKPRKFRKIIFKSAPEESKKRAKIEMIWSRNSPTQLAVNKTTTGKTVTNILKMIEYLEYAISIQELGKILGFWITVFFLFISSLVIQS